MNKTKTISTLLLSLLVFSIGGQTVYAKTPMPSGTNTAQKELNLQQRASAEITARLNSLNKIIETLNGIKKISDADRSALLNQVQTEITMMQNLQTKIQGDTDLTTLRTDVQSITNAYRIYWLFLPKIHILAASDRINDVLVSMQSLVSKLQDRITAGGSTTANLQSTLDAAKAKMSDAQTLAQNAANLVTALQPDKGDKNVLASNIAALKSARGDIQTANSDLKAAYQDFKQIIQALKALKSTSPATTP